MATINEIQAGIKAIETALGGYLCSDSQPCAANAYYDEEYPMPWRISDDHATERFATLEDAVASAEAWAESMAAN